MEIYRKPWKSLENDESPQITTLESSKGFYRGSKSYLKAARAPIPQNHENPWKYMKTMKLMEIHGKP